MAVTSFVQNGLVRIAYEAAGEGAPVVLLHGLLGDRVTVRPLADALAEGHQVVNVDLRGHGGSSAIHGVELTVADLASDVAAVMDTLGIERAAVVGIDLGAMIAAELGDRASTVVAINPLGSLAIEDGQLGSIADAAYKGLGEQAVHGWLDIAWGDAWRELVPRARVAAARRNALSLHACLTAIEEHDDQAVAAEIISLPGGTPFAEEANVHRVMQAISTATAAD